MNLNTYAILIGPQCSGKNSCNKTAVLNPPLALTLMLRDTFAFLYHIEFSNFACFIYIFLFYLFIFFILSFYTPPPSLSLPLAKSQI